MSVYDDMVVNPLVTGKNGIVTLINKALAQFPNETPVNPMLNAYRVLLTRAKAGMVICIPEGNPKKTVSCFWEDSTRLPEFYDGMYAYLKEIGIEEI